MKGKIIILALISLMFLNVGFAAQNFSLNTNSISDNLETEESSSSTFTISHTGNSSITLDVLTNPAGSISLNPNISSVSFNNQGEEETITLDYTAGSNTGIFTGEVIVAQQDNTSNNETIGVELNVTQSQSQPTLEPNIEFVDEDDTLYIEGDLGDREAEIFTLRNNGNFTLRDIEIDLEDLEGDDDDIDYRDVEFNGDESNDFRIDEMNINEERNIDIEIDIPSNIEPDTYRGDFDIDAEYDNGKIFTKTFTLRVKAISDEEDVEFRNSEPISVLGEQGENIRNIELLIENDGNNDVQDLSLEFDEDFQEENSDSTLPASAVEFEDSEFDVRDDDDIEVDMDISIPNNQAQGTYTSQLELLNSQGDRLDRITVEIRVIGDVFIDQISYPESVSPGENVEIETTIVNQGSSLYRNVKLDGFVFDVNRAGEDIERSTSSFLLNRGDETTKSLRFRLPDDATDGEKTLELRLRYGDEEVVEIEELNIERNPYNLEIESSSINPRTISCGDTINSFMEVRNLGSNDERVSFTTSIEGTNLEAQSSTRDLLVDDRTSQSLQLRVDDLEPGSYTLEQKVNGRFSKTQEYTITVESCNGLGNGVDINTSQPLQNNTNQNQTGDSGVSFFGENIDRTTAIMSVSLLVIIVLIVVSLFFL